MTALAGVTGHLLSGSFLADIVAEVAGSLEEDRARGAFGRWRQNCSVLGPASTPRALLQCAAAPLLALLGFDGPFDVETSGEITAATMRYGDCPIALLVSPWSGGHAILWREAVSHAHRRGAAWCLAFDGTGLVIIDATRLYARRHIAFDLGLAADHAATFSALWRTCHATRLAGAASQPLSLRALVAASDRHAATVCRSLRNGVLSASTDVLAALVSSRNVKGRRRVDLAAALEQALTVVYRILFLLFAEARALVPLWHPIYRESYSIESVRDQADRGDAIGLWDTLRAIGRLAHTGCRAGDLTVTAFNGRLFAPAHTPLADRADLDDESARRAVLALSTRPAPDGAGRQRVAYQDLGVEQLGAVYETLLDYEPRMDDGVVRLAAGSGVRKETGTFYTPQPIADYLVRRTLEPLVRDAEPDRLLQLRVVDPAMGSGAFLVAACRFLASAYESALVRTGTCHATDVSDDDRALFRRLVAERCLYGVDLNPMAVQLARLSLWLATLAADRPLSFLDHRLQAGDSLLGVWLASLRRPPHVDRRRSGDALPLFDDERMSSAVREALPVRFDLEMTPNDTVEQVRAKERALAALGASNGVLTRWKRVAHVWCAPWFVRGEDAVQPSAFGALSDAVLSGRGALPPAAARRYVNAACDAAESRRLFHWELEFPEVFFEADGTRRVRPGFDAVIGNPPWDMIRADPGAGADRAARRERLTGAIRFTRDSGVYSAQSAGHANRYQLFVERAIALTRERGRIGLVLPAGLALDHGSARLRRFLLARCDVDAVIGMDNHRGVFPIHRSVRFLLLTASAGAPTREISCRMGVADPADLETLDASSAGGDDRIVRLTPAALERISGPSLAIPHLQHPIDLQILERAAALFPPLASPDGWNASFGRELNATDDRDAFGSTRQGLPVIDGKHLEPFRARIDAVERHVSAADARRLLRSTRFEQPRLAYRDVAGPTNKLTLIAAVLPGRCVSTHTVFCLRTPLDADAQHFLCGLFNSLVVNYFVRTRVSTHVTTALVERLPVPTADRSPAAVQDIAALARRLARDHDAGAFAQLNARVAAIYQLSGVEFERVLETFPLVPAATRQDCLDCYRRG